MALYRTLPLIQVRHKGGVTQRSAPLPIEWANSPQSCSLSHSIDTQVSISMNMIASYSGYCPTSCRWLRMHKLQPKRHLCGLKSTCSLVFSVEILLDQAEKRALFGGSEARNCLFAYLLPACLPQHLLTITSQLDTFPLVFGCAITHVGQSGSQGPADWPCYIFWQLKYQKLLPPGRIALNIKNIKSKVAIIC